MCALRNVIERKPSIAPNSVINSSGFRRNGTQLGMRKRYHWIDRE